MENMAGVGATSPAPRTDNQHSNHSSTTPVNSSGGGGSFSVAMQSALSRHAIAAAQTSPKHIPIAEQPSQMAGHDVHERALNVQAYRLQLIASNIANADTPNYKAVDIDYREALRQGKGASAISSDGHSQDANIATSIPLKYHVPQQGNVDGNTVDMDVERAKFVDSMVRYQFSLDRVSGHYKMMSELFNNIKG